jgi:cob(I)alamin adenosyltransferase
MSDAARILIFTGDGAGKTSAALGKILRQVGRGRSAVVIQFLKADADTGEIAALARLGVSVEQCGRGFVPATSHASFPAHRTAAQRGLERAQQCIASHQAVVLDEICGAVAKGLIDEAQVLALLDLARPGQLLVLTGRAASAGLIARADTVSAICEVKHALRAGIPAQEGVER